MNPISPVRGLCDLYRSRFAVFCVFFFMASYANSGSEEPLLLS